MRPFPTQRVERRHECQVCGKSFHEQKHLDMHLQRHRERRPFIRNEGSIVFRREERLCQHVMDETEEKLSAIPPSPIQSGEMSRKCQKCGKFFNQNQNSDRHLVSDTHFVSRMPFLSGTLNTAFRREERLIPHVVDDTEDNLQEMPSYPFQSGEISHKCQECGMSFKQKQDLDRHLISDTHFVFRMPFVSGMRNSAFRREERLIPHVADDTEEKLYKRDVCKKAFAQKTNLTKHVPIHTKESHQECGICKRTFSVTYLRTHSLTHSQERPYKCDVCQKAFSLKDSLKKHSLIHTNEKPYVCDICKKAFFFRHNLNSHLHTHTDEKPHVCGICGREFSVKYYLKKHLRIHTNEKPYVCEICGKAFSREESLNNHSSRSHQS